MTGLLGPNGRPISSKDLENKKSPAPKTGEKYGRWGGPDVNVMKMPGGGALSFDLDLLTLQDFREMRDHYQVNSSLSVLMFLLHQLEWRVECEDKKQQEFYTEQLENVWTPLVRSMSQAFWAGFSPNIIQWDNDVAGRRIVFDKIKDLRPEEALVKWKVVDGEGTHKINIYDGIHQVFGGPEVPVDNTFWYPLLMEHGDYYGRKLLRSAFQPWFFSILIHLFANRYYERFGEPTPVGRAPYDDDIVVNGVTMTGNQAMEGILTALRNRSVVILPNDKTPFGDETTIDYDYQIEYLESQMRGADFERYMTRLDEEISLGLFTPILMTRTADVGSYNLGDMQSQVYQWMLNAIAGDWKRYIDKYLLAPLRNFNFGTNAEPPKIKFKRMGDDNLEMVRDVVRAMVAAGQVKPDITELGELSGLTLTEVKQLTEETPSDNPDPNSTEQGGSSAAARRARATENRRRVSRVANMLSERIAPQVRNAFKKKALQDVEFSLGFQAQMETAMTDLGKARPVEETRKFYTYVDQILKDMAGFGEDDYTSPEDFMRQFNMAMELQVDALVPA